MWDLEDAWVLQSVVYAGMRGDLRKVIANADAINVEIPSRDTLERTIGRLEAASLLRTDGTRVRATRDGRRLLRRSGGRWSGIRTITPLLHIRLNDDVPVPARPSGWTLSESDWRDAYDRYIAQHNRDGNQ